MPAAMQFRLTGGASNSNPNTSFGGTGSTQQVSGVAMNNLFDNVTPPQAAAGLVEYRAIDLYNSGDAAAQSVELFVSADTTSASSEIDLASEGVNPASPKTIVDEIDSTNQLSGLTFTHPASGTKLSLPDIAAGSRCRIWLRRTIQAGAANIANDTGSLSVWFA